MTAAGWNAAPAATIAEPAPPTPRQRRPEPEPLRTWQPPAITLTDAAMLDAFKAYVDRQLADYLRPGDPPASWPASADSWNELRSLALAGLQAQLAGRFIAELAAGWSVSEVVSGQPAPGSERLASGLPKRPLRCHLSVVTQEKATVALRLASTLPPDRHIGHVFMSALERASRGDPSSPVEAVVLAAIQAAHAASQQAERERGAAQQAAAAAKAGGGRVHILEEFVAGGVRFEPGPPVDVTRDMLAAIVERAAKEPDRDLYEVVS